ncbi:transmembrane protein 177 isoform X2 [Zerene cesonia]|uniref:transmembrane protein 177 isoform X1 n=1 Tax=Zerene cesonia TaxID=33412 RepID=UPI0018E5A7DC|nr:transmembrane protein 177 isoform X1 [Zerene cesonia]XP_038214975.1 transmembrane protein 177 isoform X2 [Zerene cesonia]
MTTRKPISWFLTEQGRRFSFAVVTGTGLALTAVRYTPHTFLIDKYRDFVRYYSAGKPVELSEQLQQRFNKCLDILNLSDVHKKIVKPFSVYGFDLFHAGSTSSRFGVQIGIPVNFNYKSLVDIEKDNLQVNQKRVDLTTEVGSKLSEALILPEKVQEFAMCREILMTHNNKIMFESAYPFMSIFLVYNLSSYLNKKLNLYAAPTALRSIMYSITGLFGVGIYFLFKDMTEVHYEARTDEVLSKLGPDFIESGIIFYEKLLARNQALRELMGAEGEAKYSVFGNENYGLRQPHIALVHRKQFFENIIKEHRGETSSE